MKNLIALLLTLSAGGLFYVYVGPTFDEIKGLRAEKAEYDEALNNSQKVQDARDELLGKYNAFAPKDLQRLEKLLPNYVDNIRLIIEIDSVAARYNMILKNVQIIAIAASAGSGDISNQALPDAKTNSYGTAEFSFEVSGPYEVYRNFIKDLEYSLRVIDIRGISIVAVEGEKNASDMYNFKTSLNTYWLKPK